MSDLTELKYATGGLPDEFTKWHNVLTSLLSIFRADMMELTHMTMISKAKSKWLDNFGILVELNRPTRQVYLRSDEDLAKEKKDSFYRLVILLKTTSLYDDYTYNVFSELAEVFKVGERLLVNIFDDFIQYSFVDLVSTEVESVREKYLLLNDFKVGRGRMRITSGETTTFRLGGTFGKFSELIHEDSI